MRIDPAGWPFVGGAVAAAAAAWLLDAAVVAAALALLSGFFLFFFRDPDRSPPAAARGVLSPADGRVLVAGPPGPGAPPGDWAQVSIFLSPMDVHVNRVPVSGRVTKVRYQPGRFLPAYRQDAGALNEYTEVWVDHAGQPIVFRQIVGVLARRIVCRVREGAVVQAGDRFGVMKFGSRMDVFVPADARLRVTVGERVTGGVTILAELQP